VSIEGLPEKQLANTRTQRDINAIIEYLRTLADGAGGSAHIIAKESLQYAQRSILDFSGEGVQVLDYPGSDTTRVLIGGSSGSAGDAGADIRIIGNTIQRAGNGVLLYDAGGDPVREYAFTEAGVTEAFADSASGDVVDLPAGTLTGDVTVPAGRTLRGMGCDVGGLALVRNTAGTLIQGTVTLGGGSALRHISVEKVENSVAAVTAIIIPALGSVVHMWLDNVYAYCTNNDGPAYALSMAALSTVYAKDADLIVNSGADGYAAYVTAGALYHLSGRAQGTVATHPYYTSGGSVVVGDVLYL